MQIPLLRTKPRKITRPVVAAGSEEVDDGSIKAKAVSKPVEASSNEVMEESKSRKRLQDSKPGEASSSDAEGGKKRQRRAGPDCKADLPGTIIPGHPQLGYVKASKKSKNLSKPKEITSPLRRVCVCDSVHVQGWPSKLVSTH